MDPSQALVVSVERVASQLKQAEFRIEETQRQKIELRTQSECAQAEVLQANERLQAAQHQHASAKASINSYEDELLRHKSNNARLKQEILQITEQIEQLCREEETEQLEFIHLCEQLRDATMILVQQCDSAGSLLVGTAALPNTAVA